MKTLHAIAVTLLVIGGINWGLIGFFQFDLVSAIFGGQTAILSRIIYGLVGISAIYYLTTLFSGVGETMQDTDDLPANLRAEFGEDYGIEEEIKEEMDDK
ncbi:DUF378 domain-containing protein [Oceanobacillus sp. J11TS1]|uniref:DUF378 domain-containing protein n=1 Tax=Oceanobacillus sp. J11TS1 TaxID=2807191 RepID=UPI001B177BF7|nr:DUF378 domain-containing protein [Oceanobacillus sp. J11TS1]GIO25005.1 hypothetical protein J11TS1_35860 [Oceanobacillus sp. J11TS1]